MIRYETRVCVAGDREPVGTDRIPAILHGMGYRGLATTDCAGAARAALDDLLTELKPCPHSREYSEVVAAVQAFFGLVGEI